MLPDTSSDEKMAQVGRMTVLRKHRRDLAQRLRDMVVPLLNAIEQKDNAWDVSGIAELVEEINTVNRAISELSERRLSHPIGD